MPAIAGPWYRPARLRGPRGVPPAGRRHPRRENRRQSRRHHWPVRSPAPPCPRSWSLSDKPPNHLGGVIHHRDDAGVVDPRRADDPDRADDLLAAVLIRRDDQRTAGDAEQMAFSADKDLHPPGLLAGIEQAMHGPLVLPHLD